ncbi:MULTISPECIES: ABC transporter permease [unclassified Frigoribacterium]|jgi:peptide/nickel transport system permease protein|uniref:ABC transporter permease n=1 Tax=unclassified Frigoribacterium TaxID=2627005 RepID=UPI0009E1DD48|nr:MULTISPECIES: ABC transporter permease [unclassified Frigoribacterium]MBD8538914.1 ABC transporter permease [Frigoribacterium sp. CFBP 8751]
MSTIDLGQLADPNSPTGDSGAGAGRKGLTRVFPHVTPKLWVGAGMIAAIALFGLVFPFVVQNPQAISDVGLSAPSGDHLLGTTQTGQDVFAQLAYATRGSLLIGVLVGVVAMALAIVFGVIGTYVGGFVDEAFSLFSNVVLVIPGLPLAIIVSSYVPQKGLVVIAFVIVITSWAASARVLRAITLSLRSRDYVAASRVSGEKTWRIVAVEILPNVLPVLASQFLFAVIFAILAEAGLSFLGLGVSGQFTWGSMLYFAQNGLALRLGAWWWFVPPGLMIALLGCALSLMNFAIDEIINPKLRDQTRAGVSRADRKRLARAEAAAGTTEGATA